MSYSTISDFGQIMNTYTNDPALYCVLDGLDSQFMFGSTGFQKGNFNCSEYMSNKCAAEWDSTCEAVFHNSSVKYPRPQCCPVGLTDGQAMLREAAFKKYLLSTKNCWFACEPFDHTVADSPLFCYDIQSAPSTGTGKVAYWTLDGHRVCGGPAADNPPCERFYGFTDQQMAALDSDQVMNNLLKYPNVALDLLAKLAAWVKSTSNMYKISGTKFHRFASDNHLY